MNLLNELKQFKLIKENKVSKEKLILSDEQVRQLRHMLDKYRVTSHMSYYSSILNILERAINLAGLMKKVNDAGISGVKTSERTNTVMFMFKNKIVVIIYCDLVQDRFKVIIETDDDEADDVVTLFEKAFINPYKTMDKYKKKYRRNL